MGKCLLVFLGLGFGYHNMPKIPTGRYTVSSFIDAKFVFEANFELED